MVGKPLPEDAVEEIQFELDDVQWQHTRRAIELHGRVAPLLDDGAWRRFGPRVESYHTPTGWQALLRPTLDGTGELELDFNDRVFW